MTKTATQAVVEVQYDKLVKSAVNEEGATNDEILLAQQIQQVWVYNCCCITLPELFVEGESLWERRLTALLD